jgi:GT2 family glycosyltransferase
MKYKVFVSIVFYNTSIDIFSKTIKNLINKKDIYLSVFDNGNNIDVKSIAKKCNFNYIKSKKNFGFGRGHNRNLEIFLKNFSAKYFLILNPDVFISYKNITNLINAYEQNKSRIKIVSPILLNIDNSNQNFLRPFPNLYSFFKRVFLKEKRNFDIKNRTRDFTIPFAHGACYLLTIQNFLLLDGFDKRFFLYCEDLDLCRKVYFKNGRVIICVNSKVIHVLNKESSKSFYLFMIHFCSILMYFFKWGFFNNIKINKVNNLYTKYIS